MPSHFKGNKNNNFYVSSLNVFWALLLVCDHAAAAPRRIRLLNSVTVERTAAPPKQRACVFYHGFTEQNCWSEMVLPSIPESVSFPPSHAFKRFSFSFFFFFLFIKKPQRNVLWCGNTIGCIYVRAHVCVRVYRAN